MDEFQKTAPRSTNPVLIFVDENCIIDPHVWVSSSLVYSEYERWCKETHNKILSRDKFYDQILMNLSQVKEGMVEPSFNRRERFIGMALKWCSPGKCTTDDG
jgi:hypothetical protein